MLQLSSALPSHLPSLLEVTPAAVCGSLSPQGCCWLPAFCESVVPQVSFCFRDTLHSSLVAVSSMSVTGGGWNCSHKGDWFLLSESERHSAGPWWPAGHSPPRPYELYHRAEAGACAAAQHWQPGVSRAGSLAVREVGAVALKSVLWEGSVPVFSQLFSLLVLSHFCFQYFTAVKMQTKSSKSRSGQTRFWKSSNRALWSVSALKSGVTLRRPVRYLKPRKQQ